MKKIVQIAYYDILLVIRYILVSEIFKMPPICIFRRDKIVVKWFSV